jgi:hypothetical protein
MASISMHLRYPAEFPWKRFFFNISLSDTLLQPYDIVHQLERVRPWKHNMRAYISTKTSLLMMQGTDEESLEEMSQPIDIGLASLRVRSYSVFSRVLYPSLHDACHDQSFLSSLDQDLPFPGQDKLLEAICDCIRYTLQSIIVFDRVEPAQRFVLSNTVSTLHG